MSDNDEKKTVKKRFRLRDVEKRLNQALKIGSEVSNLVVQLKGKPSVLAMAAIAVKGIHTYRSVVGAKDVPPTYSFYASNKRDGSTYWKFTFLTEFRGAITEQFRIRGLLQPDHKELSCMNALVEAEEVTAPSSCKPYAVEYGGMSFRIILDSDEDPTQVYWKEPPNCEPDENGVWGKKIAFVLRELFWETYGNRLKLISHSKWTARQVVQEDSTEGALESGRAEEVYERIRLFTDSGYRRAVLFYGPPGTGKSHLMRNVAERFGGRTLRIDGRVLKGLKQESIVNACRLLRPDALLIDDIDRIEDLSSFLSEFEAIRRAVPLFLASANRVKELDPAVIRPGRFDEVVEILSLDTGVIDRLLGEVPEKYREQLRKIPVAYLDEFHTRRKVLGIDKAVEEIGELLIRANAVKASEWKMKSVYQEEEGDVIDIQVGRK